MNLLHSEKTDLLFAEHYGFTAVELDFILDYDNKYCLGPAKLKARKIDLWRYNVQPPQCIESALTI